MTRQNHRSHRTKLIVGLLALVVGFGTMQTPAHASLYTIQVTNSNFNYYLRGTNGPGLPGFYCQAPLSPSELRISVQRGSTAFGSRDKTCRSSRTGKQIQGQLYIYVEWQSDGILTIRYRSLVHELSADGTTAWLCGQRWYTSNISGRNRADLSQGFTSSLRVPSQSEPVARGCATSEGDNYFAVEFTEGMRPA
jgi:hypothetical protein